MNTPAPDSMPFLKFDLRVPVLLSSRDFLSFNVRIETREGKGGPGSGFSERLLVVWEIFPGFISSMEINVRMTMSGSGSGRGRSHVIAGPANHGAGLLDRWMTWCKSSLVSFSCPRLERE